MKQKQATKTKDIILYITGNWVVKIQPERVQKNPRYKQPNEDIRQYLTGNEKKATPPVYENWRQ